MMAYRITLKWWLWSVVYPLLLAFTPKVCGENPHMQRSCVVIRLKGPLLKPREAFQTEAITFNGHCAIYGYSSGALCLWTVY